MKFDILIIGGGTAGESAARTAAALTGSVGVVERNRVGGDCVFHACIPTKTLAHAARAYRLMRRADFYGLPAFTGAFDYRLVKAFKDRIIASIAQGRDQRLAGRGIQVITGNARFLSPGMIKVDDTAIEASKTIIATGSMPAVPPIPGLKEAGYITNVEALELEKAPRRLAIIGGGAVGVEFASIFATFGADVHIYEAMDRVLAFEDDEVSGALAGSFVERGIKVTTSATVTGVRKTSTGKTVSARAADGREVAGEFDEVLVATGRRPVIQELDLPAAGVKTWERGIEVDAALRTSAPNIWAAGDVTGRYLYTTIAGEQGRAAVTNAVTGLNTELDYGVLPRAIFCDPEVAAVGLTERDARQQGFQVVTASYRFADLTRAIITDEMEGFIKVVAEAGSGRLLGGHIVGVEASTLIHEIALALRRNLTAGDIAHTFHAYPTFSEGIRYACQRLSKVD
ncbi:MAG: NAD(P)/FAD-dependent oxidoreductase [Chloroflexi bacterium]|nr:NAD(P)/FAD-dependent oxidoreductase [Chloroflexota bacterium]